MAGGDKAPFPSQRLSCRGQPVAVCLRLRGFRERRRLLGMIAWHLIVTHLISTRGLPGWHESPARPAEGSFHHPIGGVDQKTGFGL